MSLVEVRTRVGDAATGERIARALVERRLAACAHVTAGGASFYWWDGALQADAEVDVVATSTSDLLDAVVAAIAAAHPYELPGIQWHPISATDAYTDWVIASISPTPGS